VTGAAHAVGQGTSGPAVVHLTAPAKLTLSLLVTGVRPDGYHLLESEMVTLDLADTLTIGDGDGLTVTGPAIEGDHGGFTSIPAGPDNLVAQALAAVGRRARVHLEKRIPPGAGLGGGSADAAAVLRWAGRLDLDLAAGLGADVPFCIRGGRAMVRGIGEDVTPLPYVERRFVLLLLAFGVDTGAVYRAWDRLAGRGELPGPGSVSNDLEAPAVLVEPRLSEWKEVLGEATGQEPRLAGSGSTWFVEGSPEELGMAHRSHRLRLRGAEARIVPVRTTRMIG
jgi:4-diphosphocytidyl-2-C-methyl-D-erythritol kinase